MGAAGAGEIFDHTEADALDAVTEQVDLLRNLAPIEPNDFTVRVRLVVSTTVWADVACSRWSCSFGAMRASSQSWCRW